MSEQPPGVRRRIWRTVASRLVHENPWLRLREDEVLRPTGEPGRYGVLETRHDAVFVVAIDDADRVVLIEQDRYTVGWSIEVPAGGTDGEPPELAARRELAEEAGLQAGQWTAIGGLDALNGIARAPEHFFLARGLTPSGTRVHTASEQATEGIAEVLRVPWPEVLAMVADGRIRDGETVAALMLAALALGRIR